MRRRLGPWHTPRMLPCQRDAFDLPDDIAYFNCAYMAPTLRAARRAAEAALARTSAPWTLSVEDFFSPPERARALFAGLLGASAEDIAIVPSASFGISTAARNLRLGPGRVVLALEEEFPSNYYAWRDLAARDGGDVRLVPRPSDGDWTSAVLEALDEHVAIAALPHCHWSDGGLLDLVRVGAAVRARGAHLVLDVTQSLGALPLDVAQVQPDFLVCAAYKWLLGPYSLGFLYVAPRHHGGTPLDHNWITRAGAEDFSGLVRYADGYQPGARRYDMGERSSFVLLPMALAALEQLQAWTPAAISETLGAITAQLAESAAAYGAQVARPELRARHLLGLGLPEGMARDLAESLQRQQVYVSARGRTLRVAPHLWTRPSDVERLQVALARALRG